MPKQDKDRNIGKEILDGIRSTKAGKTGRISTAPGVAEIRANRANIDSYATQQILLVSVPRDS